MRQIGGREGQFTAGGAAYGGAPAGVAPQNETAALDEGGPAVGAQGHGNVAGF